MRYLMAVCFSLASFVTGVVAQELKPYDRLSRDNIEVKAQAVSTGSKVETNWRSWYGSYYKDFKQLKLVEVSLSKVGDSKGPVTLEFYTVMKQEGGNGERIVKAEGLQDAERANTWVFAASASRSHLRYRYSNADYKSGEKIMGWFVRAIRDGQIVGIAASPSAFERYATSKETFVTE